MNSKQENSLLKLIKSENYDFKRVENLIKNVTYNDLYSSLYYFALHLSGVLFEENKKIIELILQKIKSEDITKIFNTIVTKGFYRKKLRDNDLNFKAIKRWIKLIKKMKLRHIIIDFETIYIIQLSNLMVLDYIEKNFLKLQNGSMTLDYDLKINFSSCKLGNREEFYSKFLRFSVILNEFEIVESIVKNINHYKLNENVYRKVLDSDHFNDCLFYINGNNEEIILTRSQGKQIIHNYRTNYKTNPKIISIIFKNAPINLISNYLNNHLMVIRGDLTPIIVSLTEINRDGIVILKESFKKLNFEINTFNEKFYYLNDFEEEMHDPFCSKSYDKIDYINSKKAIVENTILLPNGNLMIRPDNK